MTTQWVVVHLPFNGLASIGVVSRQPVPVKIPILQSVLLLHHFVVNSIGAVEVLSD